MLLVCIGVSNKWSNYDTRWDRRGTQGGKKYPHAYFLDENGKVYSKRITKSEAIRLKLSGIYRKRKFICKNCECRFFGLIKNTKDLVNCPNCDTPTKYVQLRFYNK